MINTERDWKSALFWIIPVLFLGAFYFFPLTAVVERSLAQPASLAEFDSANLQAGWRAIRFSLLQALLSTALTFLLGMPSAYLFGRFNFTGKKALRLLSTLPFILPTVVVAAGFNTLLGPKGWINIALMRLLDFSAPPLQVFGTLGVVLLAHVFYNTSVFIRVVGTAWERLDVKIEDAARILAASPRQTLAKVTLPLLLPSIISAALLVFLFNFTSFGVILLMGSAQFATMEVEIYIQTSQFLNLKIAGLLALVQLIFTIGITLLSHRIDAAAYTPVMPLTGGEGLKKAHGFLQRAFVFAMFVVLVLVTAAPLLALILRAFIVQDSSGAAVLSLSNFQRVFVNERDALFFVPPFAAFRNSLLYALAAAIVALVVGVTLVVGGERSRKAGRLTNVLVMLPLGTSAVTLGLGYLLAFSGSRAAVAYFPFLIPLAHALIAQPFVVRIIQPALRAIPSSQHDAAVMLGVPAHKLWWKIDLPIIRKPLITAAIYAYAISLGEFGATAFLTRPEFPTLPIAIFRYLGLPGQENYGKALAMAVILLFACSLGFIAIEQLQETKETS